MSVFKKLNLKKDFNKTIDSDFDNFYENFQNIVDHRRLFIKFEPMDFFSNSKNELVGYVKNGKFKVRRKKEFTLFDFKLDVTTAKGTFESIGDKTIVKAKVSSIDFRMFPFLILSFLFLSFFFFLIAFSSTTFLNKLPPLVIISLLFLVIFIFPLISMRKDVDRLYKILDEKL